MAIVLNGALAEPRAAFGGVRVDVASLRAEVGDPTARWVAEELPGARRGSGQRRARRRSGDVADRHRDPRAEHGGQGPQGASPDQILGEVIVGGVARSLRAPTSYYPMAVDQALVEQSNHDRVSQLVQAFANCAARRSEVARSSSAPSRRSGTGCAVQVVQTHNHARRG
jgi:hypothetical protein